MKKGICHSSGPGLMLSVHLFLCFHSIRSNIYRRNINRRCVLTPFLSNVCWNWTRPAHTEKKIWSSSSNTKKRARDGVKKLKRYAAQHTLLNMSAHTAIAGPFANRNYKWGRPPNRFDVSQCAFAHRLTVDKMTF